MKILVTGGAGFIGSHTCDMLLRKGYEVRILDSLEKPVHLKGKPPYILDDVEFIQGDVRNKEDLLQALKGVEVIFHFAAYQDYLTDFSRFFHVNSVGTALLYELLVENKSQVKKVIVASSQAVYGEGKYTCTCQSSGDNGVFYPNMRPEAQLREGRWEISCPKCGQKMHNQPTDESIVNPQNQYAISKYSQELIALNTGKRYDIPTVVLRYSIVQGPRQSFFNAYSGACRIFVLSLYFNTPPPIYEDGKQLRDYVNIEDVVNANMLVLEDDRANYQIFNVGGGRAYTVLELYKEIAKALNKDMPPLIDGKYRFGDTRHIVSDISKLKSLGWRPVHTIEKSVKDYVNWFKGQECIENILEYTKSSMEKWGIVRRVKRH